MVMRGYRAIALTASVSVFMQLLDSTALNTAIPAIARDLGVSPIDMNVAILGYQLAMVLFIPLANLASARVGARNAFILSLAVFTVGALLSALSASLPALVAARTLQGMAGAIMMPVARTLVIRSAERSELISAMNWLIIPAIVGPIAGPALGGLLVTYLSWHAIFLVNVPIALMGIVMAFILVPDRRDEAPAKFDATGAVLIAPAIVGLVLGLGGIAGPQSVAVTGLFLAMSLAFGIAYIRHARRALAPIMDISFFAVPSFRHSAISGSLLRAIVGATGFLMPLWFQLAMGISAVETGAVLMTSAAGALLGRFAGGTLIRHLQPRTLAIGGVAALSLSLLATAFLQPDWPRPVFYLLLVTQGLAMSIALLVINPAAFVELPPERIAGASAAYTLVQQFSLALGVILGVGTINAMRWLIDASPADGVAYSGGMIILALMTAGVVFTTRWFDREIVGTLRPEPLPTRL